eukprot:8474299-Pyramimonas_sp.AAC.1
MALMGQKQRDMAHKRFELALSLVSERVWSLFLACATPPLKYANVLSDSDDIRRAHAQAMGGDWRAICLLEQRAVMDGG